MEFQCRHWDLVFTRSRRMKPPRQFLKPYELATVLSIPQQLTETSAREARPSKTPALAAMTSLSKPKSGSVTTASTKPCTVSKKARANSAYTPLTYYYYIKRYPATLNKP